MIKKPSGDKQVKQVNVLSLFDGLSCGQLALQRANIPVENYLASEIDKYAIQVTQKNFPYTIQLGDITEIGTRRIERMEELGIDLIIGGSPCQDLSFAGKGKGLKKGTRSNLFFEFVKILKAIKPKYFLLENVRMKKENQDIISEYMGVEPIAINSNLVSAQNRNRLYWTNIPFTIPDDKGIILADIIEEGITDREKSHCLDANYFKGGNLKSYFEKHRRQLVFNEFLPNTLPNKSATRDGKAYALTYSYPGAVAWNSIERKQRTMIPFCRSDEEDNPNVVEGYHYRKLTPIECERLQTVPDNYTEVVSNTQRYKMLGNGMTVDVIAHILKGIKADD